MDRKKTTQNKLLTMKRQSMSRTGIIQAPSPPAILPVPLLSTPVKGPSKVEKAALGPLKILSCIIPTDIIFRTSINPLEIARVRISKDLMSCSPSNCGSFNGQPMSCNRCLPTRSVPGVIYHIAKNEGGRVLLNGMQASMKTGLVRSGIFYPLYEYGKYSFLGTTNSKTDFVV